MIKSEVDTLSSTKEREYFVPMKIKFSWVHDEGHHALFIGGRQHLVATIFEKHGHWYVRPHKFIKGAREKDDYYKYSPQLSFEATIEHVEEELKKFLKSLESK